MIEKRSYNGSISEIIKIYDSIQRIDKLFLNRLIFEIADDQPILGGESVKFFLRGSDGNLWLFKQGESGKALTAAKLAYIFGIDSPEIFRLSLVINGRNINGSIQRFIEADRSIDLVDPLIMRQKQEEIIKLHIFHWLIDKREDAFYHLILDKKGDIYSIDLKYVLKYFNRSYPSPCSLEEKFFYRKEIPKYEVFTRFWDEYLKSFDDWKLQIPFDFICYVEDFDSDYISFLLSENNIESLNIKRFIELKKNISVEFKSFLSFLRQRTGVDVSFDCNTKKYALSQLNRFRADLREKRERLNIMPEREQQPLNIVTSFFLKDGLRQVTYNEALNIVRLKRVEAPNIYELLGLYLLEAGILNRLQQGFNGEKMFDNEDCVVSASLKNLSLSSLDNEISLLIPVDSSFLLALHYAIKGDFSRALEYLRESEPNDRERELLIGYIDKNRSEAI
ncbi:MAG: hypothetical protein P9L98_01720 [Candidatus Kaelpia imicola]|nr:hypothetical protein [Candidatus Kaelpia imicola]